MSKSATMASPDIGKDFAAIFEELGSALSEVFRDPEFKKKTKLIGESTKASAKELKKRFEDEDVKKRFRRVGKAAERFGQDIGKLFA